MNNIKAIKEFIGKYTIEIVLFVMVLISAIVEPSFFTFRNVVNVLRQCSINGILAVGMTFIIINGNIDLSVAGIVGITGMLCVFTQSIGYHPMIAIILSLSLGVVIGVINGTFVARGIAPYIMTMATDTALRGFSYIITDGKPVYGIKNMHAYLGQGKLFNAIPVPVIIWLIVIVTAYIILNKTTYGRTVYSVGGNQEASRLSGISIFTSKVSVYCISGILAALTGIILTARMASCDPTTGIGYQTDAIAATVIGGTSMSGGEGKIQKTIIGVLIIGLLSNVLNLAGVSPYIQQVVKGIIIFGAVFADNVRARGGMRKHRKISIQ